jgi:serine/threonine protein kinase
LLLNRSLLPIGAVKLIDFGLAVFGDGENLIKANSVAGTPVYLAPEVLRVTNLN